MFLIIINKIILFFWKTKAYLHLLHGLHLFVAFKSIHISEAKNFSI